MKDKFMRIKNIQGAETDPGLKFILLEGGGLTFRKRMQNYKNKITKVPSGFLRGLSKCRTMTLKFH